MSLTLATLLPFGKNGTEPLFSPQGWCVDESQGCASFLSSVSTSNVEAIWSFFKLQYALLISILTRDGEGRAEMVLPLYFSQYVIDLKPRESVKALVKVNLFQNAYANFWIFISFFLAAPKINDFDHISISVSSNSLRRHDLESFYFYFTVWFPALRNTFSDWHFPHCHTRKWTSQNSQHNNLSLY